jgi:hypothetical protein
MMSEPVTDIGEVETHPTSEELAAYLVRDDDTDTDLETVESHVLQCATCAEEIARRRRAMEEWDTEEGHHRAALLSARLRSLLDGPGPLLDLARNSKMPDALRHQATKYLRERGFMTLDRLADALATAASEKPALARLPVVLKPTSDAVRSFVIGLMQGLATQQLAPAVAYRGENVTSEVTAEERAYALMAGGETINVDAAEGLRLSFRAIEGGVSIRVVCDGEPVDDFTVALSRSGQVLASLDSSAGIVTIASSVLASVIERGLDTVSIERT